MQTIPITSTAMLEIIDAFTATHQPVPAVAAAPGWHVVGAFRLTQTMTAALQLVGVVTVEGLRMQGRLFDVTAAATVDGTAIEIVETVDTWRASNPARLTGRHVYQVQVQVVGGTAGFGIVRAASLT